MAEGTSSSRFRRLRIFLVWMLLEIIAAGQARLKEGTVLGSWLHVIASPIVTAGRSVAHGASDLSWGLGNTWRLVGENARLRGELDAERAQNLLLTNSLKLQREANHLQVAYPGLVARGQVAVCLVRNLDTGLMKIGAGWLAGIRKDAPVLAESGVAGRVLWSGPRSSWVELLTRATAAIAVEIEDSGIQALAAGTGGSDLRIEYIPRRAHVLKAMLLVTSGADGIYPPGIPVARVTKVREGSGPFLEVRAAPIVDLGRIHVCIVLKDWPGPRQGTGTP
ncbi:MAG: rod shape-determining protein MreC [Acidobacteria bacterium]|nr:rod shape-determining protein MreC [Acidobacteriota bacterium]